jgi:threonine dehydratase
MITPTYADIEKARDLVGRHLRETPLISLWKISEMLGCEYYAKAESFQPIGAFKVRGGVNLIGSLTKEAHVSAVVSASTGNHGQSLAFAGRLFGVEVMIYMPAERPNALKVQAIRSLGAEVRFHGLDGDEAVEAAQDLARQEHIRYVHHANEPLLIAGVGTMGLEIFEDLPSVDVIIVPIGAGSGACGNGLVAKHLNPDVRVIGVQSDAAPAVWHAWKENHLRPYPTMKTEHEGLGTRIPCELTVTILRDVLDEFILVSDEEINSAVRLFAEQGKLVAEGAGAAALAAAVKLQDQLRGKKVVGVLSGANIPLSRYAATLL